MQYHVFYFFRLFSKIMITTKMDLFHMRSLMPLQGTFLSLIPSVFLMLISKSTIVFLCHAHRLHAVSFACFYLLLCFTFFYLIHTGNCFFLLLELDCYSFFFSRLIVFYFTLVRMLSLLLDSRLFYCLLTFIVLTFWLNMFTTHLVVNSFSVNELACFVSKLIV